MVVKGDGFKLVSAKTSKRGNATWQVHVTDWGRFPKGYIGFLARAGIPPDHRAVLAQRTEAALKTAKIVIEVPILTNAESRRLLKGTKFQTASGDQVSFDSSQAPLEMEVKPSVPVFRGFRDSFPRFFAHAGDPELGTPELGIDNEQTNRKRTKELGDDVDTGDVVL